MGIDGLEDDTIIKCIEIGAKYKIDTERLVEEWIAFAQTNLNGNLKPTTVTLDMMERKQLNKNQEKILLKENVSTKSPNIIKVYSGNISEVTDILDVYNEGTPKRKRLGDNLNDSVNFSPASYNPEVVKPSISYEERTDRGKILETFGLKHLLEQDLQHLTRFCNVKINFVGKNNDWKSTFGRYMFEAFDVEASAINNRIDYLGNLLKKKYCDSKVSVDTNEEDVTFVYGKIRCDGDRLNAASVLLETSKKQGNAQIVTVNLRNINRYSLFPGQIVLLNAKLQHTNNRRSILIANKLYRNIIPNFPEKIPIIPTESGPLKIVVACGPFSLSDNLVYQPLQDLIKFITSNRPNVVILMGPFVDKRHSSVANGTMADTYKTHFENIMEKVTEPLQDTDIQIVIVPSVLDAHHHSVYPTPPFDSIPMKKRRTIYNNNVHMVPDPCLLNINDFLIGLTSADILFHLAKVEMNLLPENMDRMSRFAEHVLSQRSFYPIYPAQSSAPGQRRFPVDMKLMNHIGKFDVKPHILILPSNLRQFIKNVNGCIVVNPERLSKGFVGGTFASINLYPGQKQQSVEENITCRIIKI